MKVKKKDHKILGFSWAYSFETNVKIKTSLQSFPLFPIVPSYTPKDQEPEQNCTNWPLRWLWPWSSWKEHDLPHTTKMNLCT